MSCSMHTFAKLVVSTDLAILALTLPIMECANFGRQQPPSFALIIHQITPAAPASPLVVQEENPKGISKTPSLWQKGE